jgi:hypothetical protein
MGLMPLFDDTDPTGIESDTDQSWLGGGSSQENRSDSGDQGNYSRDPAAYDDSQNLLSDQRQDDALDYEHRQTRRQREAEQAHEDKWAEANRDGLTQTQQQLEAIKERQAKNPRAYDNLHGQGYQAQLLAQARQHQQAQQGVQDQQGSQGQPDLSRYQQTGNPFDIPGAKTKAMLYLALAVPAAIIFGSRHGSGGWARAVGAMTSGLYNLASGDVQQANQSYANWQQASKNVYNENFEQLGQYKEVLGDPRLGMDAKMRMIGDKASFYRDKPLEEAARANDVNAVETLLNHKEQYLASYHKTQRKIAADLPGFQHPGGHRGRGAQYENYARDYQQRFGKDPDEDPDAAKNFSFDQFRHPAKQQGQKQGARRARGSDYERYANLYRQKFGKDPDEDGNGSKWPYEQYIKESSAMKGNSGGVMPGQSQPGFSYRPGPKQDRLGIRGDSGGAANQSSSSGQPDPNAEVIDSVLRGE